MIMWFWWQWLKEVWVCLIVVKLLHLHPVLPQVERKVPFIPFESTTSSNKSSKVECELYSWFQNNSNCVCNTKTGWSSSSSSSLFLLQEGRGNEMNVFKWTSLLLLSCYWEEEKASRGKQVNFASQISSNHIKPSSFSDRRTEGKCQWKGVK